MDQAPPSAPKPGPEPAPAGAPGPLTPDDWIAAARARLIETGVEGLRIDRLARDLGVSRGSFYWHFANREALLDALLAAWLRANTAPFEAVLAADPGRPDIQFLRFCETWMDPLLFDVAFDAVVREWARTSQHAAKMVHAADKTRMDLLRTIFRGFGYDETEAEVRARVVYYHQVGYYALRVEEPLPVRRTLLPVYYRILAGLPMPQSLHDDPR